MAVKKMRTNSRPDQRWEEILGEACDDIVDYLSIKIPSQMIT